MIDIESLRDLIEDDAELLEATFESYTDTFQASFDAVKEAYKAKDYRKAEDSLHALKGMVANFFATDLVNELQRLESEAREQKLDFSKEPFDQIKAWDEALRVEVSQLIQTMQAQAS